MASGIAYSSYRNNIVFIFISLQASLIVWLLSRAVMVAFYVRTVPTWCTDSISRGKGEDEVDYDVSTIRTPREFLLSLVRGLYNATIRLAQRGITGRWHKM